LHRISSFHFILIPKLSDSVTYLDEAAHTQWVHTFTTENWKKSLNLDYYYFFGLVSSNFGRAKVKK